MCVCVFIIIIFPETTLQHPYLICQVEKLQYSWNVIGSWQLWAL